MSGASGVNLPLLVAGVFAATFLVVCALAYLFIGRAPSSASSADSPTPLAPDPHQPDQQAETSQALYPTLGTADSPAAVSIGTITHASSASPGATSWPAAAAEPVAPSKPLDAGKTTVLRLYRLLMFLTGGSGLVASYLMYTAVEGFSRLLLIAIVVFGLSLAALSRGFVPDPELTGKK